MVFILKLAFRSRVTRIKVNWFGRLNVRILKGAYKLSSIGMIEIDLVVFVCDNLLFSLHSTLKNDVVVLECDFQ